MVILPLRTSKNSIRLAWLRAIPLVEHKQNSDNNLVPKTTSFPLIKLDQQMFRNYLSIKI